MNVAAVPDTNKTKKHSLKNVQIEDVDEAELNPPSQSATNNEFNLLLLNKSQTQPAIV